MIVVYSCGNMFTGWLLCIVFSVVAGKGLLTNGWDTGSSHKYTFSTTVLFREVGSTKLGGDVGFRLTGSSRVSAIWRDPADYDRVLLKFDLLSPQLWIKSRKAPEPEGFVEHSSKVDESASYPALAVWRHGEVQEIYLHQSDSVSSANLKRGLISLFYYRTLDGEIREQDASGWCNVSYSSLGPRHIIKRKYLCEGDNVPLEKHIDPILDVDIASTRDSTYELSYNLMPKTIKEEERHEMTLKSRPEVGATVSSRRILDEITGGVGKSEVIDGSTLEEIINRSYSKHKKSSLELQPEPFSCPESGCQTMEEVIKENQDALDKTAIGTVKSALAFLKVLPLVKETSKFEDLEKILKSPRNKPLRIQLVDIFGAASTPVAHRAAMKILRQDETGNEMERYLWSLSLSPKPHVSIIQDIIDRSEEVLQNDKVSETLALTAAAMANHHGSPAIVETARVSLTKGLESCTGDECKMKFLRALRNLKSEKSVPTLLYHAINGTKLVSLTAWRALSTLPRACIDDQVKNAAKRVFFQLGGQKRDSSVRTMALNILLETCSSKEDLQDLVHYFASFDPAYEVRKYLGQRMDQLAEKNPAFSKYLKQTFRNASRRVNNYNVFAQKGLSTAFSRKFLESRGSNGSLITIQEVNGGLLKRGVVDVVLETRDREEVIFSLGLFAGGLSSFVSSEQDNEIDEEVATAGMEIDLLGVGVRPFTFFTGQGELMSHVWSGTASERTPAFQLLSSLHNHKQIIPLTSGFIADIGLQGALSFDLAGQIQLSLWSRNAQSLVDLAAGIAVLGSIKTRSSFIQSQADFSLTLEPKLELATDVDFAGNVALCMRLSQPETIIKYQVYKIERIPGSRHRLRKTRRSKFLSPAKSYLLNKKNNEMCSKVFN